MASLTPVLSADATWLHDVAITYFQELVPEVPGPPRAEIDDWIEDPDVHPLLITVSKKRVGFALVDRAENQSELSEFCILPDQRGAGIGTLAAIKCFQKFPGPWTLGVASALPGTERFWDRLLMTHPGIQGLARRAAFTPYQSHSYTFTFRDKK